MSPRWHRSGAPLVSESERRAPNARTPTDRPLRVLIGIPTAVALFSTGWLLVGTLDFRSRWETASATESRVGGYEYDHFLSWGGEAMGPGLVALALLTLLARGLLRGPSPTPAWALRQSLAAVLAATALGLASRLADRHHASIAVVLGGPEATAHIAGGLAVVTRAELVGAVAALAAAPLLVLAAFWRRGLPARVRHTSTPPAPIR